MEERIWRSRERGLDIPEDFELSENLSAGETPEHKVGYFIESQAETLEDVHYFHKTKFSVEALDLGYLARQAAEHFWEVGCYPKEFNGAILALVIGEEVVKKFEISVEHQSVFHAVEVGGGLENA